MAAEYHDPHAFRYNLNAFIQALRNVTFILQAEKEKPDGFAKWYENARDRLKADDRLKRFVNARNLIVKRQMLESSSELKVGIFRGRRYKLGVGGDVIHYRSSHEILKTAQAFFVGNMIDEGHSALWEQLGVFREWRVQELGQGEVVSTCCEALSSIARLVEEANSIWGYDFNASFDEPNVADIQVLLESDVDPSLPMKWGWTS